MSLAPYEDPNHEGNSARHLTGKKCIDCENPAGTAWSHLWCFDCNVKRMRRIDDRFREIERGLSRIKAAPRAKGEE